MKLYLGLELPEDLHHTDVHHYPVIQIIPRSSNSQDIQEAFQALPQYTHVIMSSKNAVRLFFHFLNQYGWHADLLQEICFIAVGKATATLLKEFGIRNLITSKEETSEGIVEELERLPLSKIYCLWPHSALSRPVLREFLGHSGVRWKECSLYETKSFNPGDPPDLTHFSEIVFTSPSTVDGFLAIYGVLPKDKILKAIGPVTESYLEKKRAMT